MSTQHPLVTLKAGLVCVQQIVTISHFQFEDITTTITLDSPSTTPSKLLDMQHLSIQLKFSRNIFKEIIYCDGSLDQRFILDNPFIGRLQL